jgi:hypothetical protein
MILGIGGFFRNRSVTRVLNLYGEIARARLLQKGILQAVATFGRRRIGISQ